jgi:hypothetical protein
MLDSNPQIYAIIRCSRIKFHNRNSNGYLTVSKVRTCHLQWVCASNHNTELRGGQSVATSPPISLAEWVDPQVGPVILALYEQSLPKAYMDSRPKACLDSRISKKGVRAKRNVS